MQLRQTEIGGLQTTAVIDAAGADTMIIALHGYSMSAADLAPFASSLGVPATYLFPEGFLAAQPAGRAWFPMDIAARQAAGGAARDLVDRVPEGLAEARGRLYDYLQACRRVFQPARVILGGFSQGGMLSCDLLLHREVNVAGLLLLSASRLNYAAWRSQQSRLQGLPTLVSHGENDSELAYSAGVGLREFLVEAGADVTWVSFPGGHEIPLVVWRAVRSFLRRLTRK